MSILINGMEMPTEDEEIIIRIDSSGTVMTEYALPISWAKAVPVPAHGRLIDADALMEKFRLPKDLLDPAQVLMHITGVRVAIQTAPTIVQASEEGET